MADRREAGHGCLLPRRRSLHHQVRGGKVIGNPISRRSSVPPPAMGFELVNTVAVLIIAARAPRPTRHRCVEAKDRFPPRADLQCGYQA